MRFYRPLIGLAISVWLVTGVTTFGGMNAFWKAEFPHRSAREIRQDHGLDFIIALSGPAGFLASLGVTGFFADGWEL